MNTEIIKTTLIIEKKCTYPNGLHVLYTLKDNDLYSYSLMKGSDYYNYYLTDLAEVKDLPDYKALSYFEKHKLSFKTEKEILEFNDFNSLYCIPENIVKNIDDEYLNFCTDLKGSFYNITDFKPTKKAVELFSEYLSKSPFVQFTTSLTVEPVAHYNQNSYENFISYHISSGLIKFSDEVFVKSIKHNQHTFYVQSNEILRKIEELFVKEHSQQLEEIFKKELEDLF